MVIIVIALLSYLLGSVPAAYLAGRLRGIDIRKVGSGNPGASNALRTMGPSIAIPVLLFDSGKGAFSVLVIAPSVMACAMTYANQTGDALLNGRLVAGAAVIIGHVFPVWLGFKGGKGVATGAAVIAVLAPWAALACLATFLLVVVLTRFVSLASMAAAIVLPIAYAVFTPEFSAQTLAFCLASSLLIIFMHRSNIGRLRKGTEPRL